MISSYVIYKATKTVNIYLRKIVFQEVLNGMTNGHMFGGEFIDFGKKLKGRWYKW